ncbi:MAG: aspartate aminotransferase family protein [Nanoarchaeota archaeon]|nr:aspartate aminotransferase family protein [Nanoarchaeota archaeon]
MGIKLKTKIPGPKSKTVLFNAKKLNGGWSDPLPLVMSGKGKGSYFYDIDGNKFLDFASQIASNPLGYNHKRLLKVVKRYRNVPVKIAGQDFITREHVNLMEELVSISKGMNAAFLINSGAEATENSIKICLDKKKTAKFGISFESAFHGRTLGALSCTNSKSVQKGNYFQLPMRRLPYNDHMKERFERIIEEEAYPEDIGFVIIESVQGEGGYNFPSNKMVSELNQLCKKYKVPLIADEVQSGMGRTGKWWAYENFGLKPDVIASAKALQVGAVVSRRDMFPKESGRISSTWGGGHLIDMALGLETIKVIKDDKLLNRNNKMGEYLLNRLKEESGLSNVRGKGLMCAFDVQGTKFRNNLVLEMIMNGVAIIACGEKSVRVIPPFVVTEKEIDEMVEVLHKSMDICKKKGFRHKGSVCEITGC